MHKFSTGLCRLRCPSKVVLFSWPLLEKGYFISSTSKITNIYLPTEYCVINTAEKIKRAILNLHLLKYGFCKKLLRYKWTSDKLNTFFLTFWLVCYVTSQNVKKKVFNCSEVHLYRSNFLQNPYFTWQLKKNITLSTS